MTGAVLYLVGLDGQTKEQLKNTEPCRICKRQIVNAGIGWVIARQGRGHIRRYSVAEWVKNNLYELRKVRGRFVPVKPPHTLAEPVDEERAKRLISRFSLADAVVVQVGSYEQAKHAVARVAARYFVSNVRSGSSVGLSCGDTVLSMLQSLPNLPTLKLTIHQLSIENDPAMIHQAPATLVGLLRSRCSPKSRVFGLQLPPLNLVPSSSKLREELGQTKILKKMMRDARGSDYIFLGLGSTGPDSTSFWAMAQAATGGKFSRFVKKLGIVGEINNQVFNRSGEDCTHLIPGFDKNVVNIATLADIRKMARKPAEHRVVMVATGPTKTQGMRVALEAGLANVLITGREDADQLLAAGPRLKPSASCA
jgi:DNA-binding transcriptional regulator LsrR (DeoR family)